MTAAAPPARRRLVGGALRRYRENVGYDLADAARVLGCDRSKISRIETGERGVRAPDLILLLVEYGVEARAREALVALSRPRAKKGWWDENGGAVLGEVREFGAIEALASAIMVYEAHRVPDLLQTEEYARALIDAHCLAAEPAAEDVRDQMLAALRARQAAVLERRAEITLVIAEAALLNVVGGPRVTRAQLDWLARVSSDSGHVSVHVLPLACGAQAAAAGPMTIVGINGVPSLGAVHVPGVQGGACLVDASDVAAHARAFEQLKLYALPSAQSARLLRELAARRGISVAR